MMNDETAHDPAKAPGREVPLSSSAESQAPAGPATETPAVFRPPTVIESWPGWPGMRVSLGVLALVAGGAALTAGKTLLMPIVLAILLTLLLTPAVSFTDRLRLPRWLGSLIVVAVVLAALLAAVTQLSAPAQRWLNPMSPEWSKLEFRVREVRKPLEQILGAQERATSIAEGSSDGEARPKPREIVVERRGIFEAIGETKTLLVGVLSTIVLLYFLLASGDMFLRKLIRVLPRLTDKKTAVGIARTIQTEIGRYFLTIAAINLGLGVVTAGLMALLGMPSAVFWGALAAALNFIPYAGPGVSLLLLTAGAFVSLDNWAVISAVPLSFFALVLIEGQLIQPMLVGRRLQLNVVVTFLAVLLWGWLWGLGGIVVAIPILVVLRICADHIAALSTFGEFISRD